MTKIYLFTKGDRNTPSSRTRAFLIFDRINKSFEDVQQIVSTIEMSQKKFIKRLFHSGHLFFLVLRAKKDVVFFLQRPIYSKYVFGPLVLALLLKRSRRVIFDFDDAIYVHSPVKTKIMLKLSTCVIVGNMSLYKWAVKRSNCVHLIPTSIDYDLYSSFSSQKNNAAGQPIIIGWIGSGSAHVDNLELLQKPLQRLAKKYNFTFRIIGAEGVSRIYDVWQSLSTEFGVEIIDQLKWSDPASAPREVSAFDIGVMPLIDNAFNRGKSSFKAIEYMAAGVPVVISPVGENSRLVKDGHTGLLAHTEEDWYQKIEQLIIDSDMRASIGQRGQILAREHYSLDRNAQKVLEVISGI